MVGGLAEERGVVDQHVAAAEIVLDAPDKRLDTVAAGEVGLHRQGPPAQRLDLGYRGADRAGDPVLLLDRARRDDHLRAQLGELNRDHLADAAAASRHHGDLAFQAPRIGHAPPPFRYVGALYPQSKDGSKRRRRGGVVVLPRGAGPASRRRYVYGEVRL